MSDNLDVIVDRIVGNWYSEDGTIQFNIDYPDGDYEGDFITIASKPLEKNKTVRYKLYEKDDKTYIRIAHNEWEIVEITKKQISLKQHTVSSTLHKELPANR